MKERTKNIIKCSSIAVGAGLLTFLACKYLPDPVKKNDEDEYNVEYERGYHNALVEMVDYCKENGKSIVLETDTNDYLVARVVNEKPEGVTDYPYTIKMF